MRSHKLSYPSKGKENTPASDMPLLEDFLAEKYKPANTIDWNSLLLSDKQPECTFSDSSDLTVQQYIDTVLSKYPDFSLQTLSSLSKDEMRILTDMLLKMNLAKLQECFWDYILYYLIFEAYPYGRYESYLKEYCEKYLWLVTTYWRVKIEMLRYASRRLWLKETTFVDKLRLLKLFLIFQSWKYQDKYKRIIETAVSKNIDASKITIVTLAPRTTSPYWYTTYDIKYKYDIHKNESRVKDCYLDAPIALALLYQGEEIAVISGMLWDENEFVIHQMQIISSFVYNGYGVKKPNITHPVASQIPRQDILFDCLIDTLKSEWITNIYIQPADKNYRTEKMYRMPVWDDVYKEYVDEDTTVPHLSKQIAHQIYDVFAQKHGYKQNESWFWHKPI